MHDSVKQGPILQSRANQILAHTEEDSLAQRTRLSDRNWILNGNGCFLYPSPEFWTAHLHSSVRWELIREGFEDFEYLCVLRDAIARGKQDGRDDKTLRNAERVLANEPEKVIRMRKCKPGTKGFDAYQVNDDPDNLMRVREEVAENIVALKRKPGFSRKVIIP